MIVQVGDSIGAGDGSFAAIDRLGLGDGVTIVNASASGRFLTTGYAMIADLLGNYDAKRTCVMLIEQGTNDLRYGGVSGIELYRSVAAPFVARAQQGGFYVALNTILPRADGNWSAVYEVQRQAYNELVRANAAGADAINDVDADPVIGSGNPDWQRYYYDKLHPNDAGQERLVVIDRAILSSLLVRTPRMRA